MPLELKDQLILPKLEDAQFRSFIEKLVCVGDRTGDVLAFYFLPDRPFVECEQAVVHSKLVREQCQTGRGNAPSMNRI
jgi:hypothetical protein